jgi:4-amino-4-deoxy-L-arabinose transferase-like glycosyltransferase
MQSVPSILTARGAIESKPDATVAGSRPVAGTRTLLMVICAIAFALRVAAIVGLHAWDNPGAMEHDAIAKFLVAGQGFTFSDWGLVQPTSVQSPLMPGILAIAFLIFGSGTTAAYASVMILNAAFGALSCAATFAMTRAVGGTFRVAIIAAALVAVWPTQIYASTFVQAIALITAATCAIVWLWNRCIDTGGTAAWLGYGLIGCLAALTEPVLLPFMAFSGLLILAWRGISFSSRARGAMLLFLCAVVVLAPWAWRNYNIHGAMVPVKSTFWVNVWKGNNAYATGTDRLPLTDAQRAVLAHDLRDDELRGSDLDQRRQYDLLTPEQKMELWEKPEVEREPIFGRYAKDFIRENPATYAKLCGIRLWKTLWVEADNPKSHGLKQYFLYWLPRSVLLVMTPIGFWLAWRRRWRLGVPLLIVATAIVTYTLTIAAARFALPYEPMQLALVALVISVAYDRITGRYDTEVAR